MPNWTTQPVLCNVIQADWAHSQQYDSMTIIYQDLPIFEIFSIEKSLYLSIYLGTYLPWKLR